MGERKIDRSLHIRTVGLREWGEQYHLYNRYEATPYHALDELFKHYKMNDEDQVVDFGSGRGRVSFYIHQRFNVPVVGIEANEKTFAEALENKASYRKKRNHLKAPIIFHFGLAEQYIIEPKENCFYFFNPFSIRIFKKVVYNILQSAKQYKRNIDIVLYYPLPEFKHFLQMETPFQLIQKIKVHNDHGKYGKFVIYRLTEEQIEASLL